MACNAVSSDSKQAPLLFVFLMSSLKKRGYLQSLEKMRNIGKMRKNRWTGLMMNPLRRMLPVEALTLCM